MDLERMHLRRVDSVDIIDYVKKSVEILMSMREDEFASYKMSWDLQEQIRLSKEKRVPDPLMTKPYRTPKNSRFFAKIRKETESMVTPKTNKKRLLLQTSLSPTGSFIDDFNEYEACVQKLENDIRKHIRTEQQLKLHVE
jgi:hypothetical protein